ncbi:hypothetical protein [Permianibacter aggregans]|uniref:Uncharacterized protein n=1 Tax=Permianibacter aggregans TaxID=1510150 RepID=A0A4R6U8B5_9GAMM|nr:hypothetical protein [Permianibacter aggregans]QGX40924.1 hypothetical protein E2H98_15125 [Permianibacter aggregans]TDQ41962.1 hypothetical protein EV696_1365 [Permianibacter aggregans]
MALTIKHIEKTRESFGDYRYGIYQDGQLIAYFWHDYRGDENGIEFVNGVSEYEPVGRTCDFISGGGPQPLALSDRAIAYINMKWPTNSA